MPQKDSPQGKNRHQIHLSLCAEPRRPQQERGQRRVDSILDAAGALIAEEGVGGATMHRVARRSDTTIGSMYHFFPESETLLRTLVERHARELLEIVTRTERDAAVHWPRLSTSEVVEQFLDPFLAYVDEHPDVLPLMRFSRTANWASPHDAELDTVALRLSRALVTSRNPKATPMEVASRAVAISAMAEGVVYAAGRSSASSGMELDPADIRLELSRALVAYLDSYARATHSEER